MEAPIVDLVKLNATIDSIDKNLPDGKALPVLFNLKNYWFFFKKSFEKFKTETATQSNHFDVSVHFELIEQFMALKAFFNQHINDLPHEINPLIQTLECDLQAVKPSLTQAEFNQLNSFSNNQSFGGYIKKLIFKLQMEQNNYKFSKSIEQLKPLEFNYKMAYQICRIIISELPTPTKTLDQTSINKCSEKIKKFLDSLSVKPKNQALYDIYMSELIKISPMIKQQQSQKDALCNQLDEFQKQYSFGDDREMKKFISSKKQAIAKADETELVKIETSLNKLKQQHSNSPVVHLQQIIKDHQNQVGWLDFFKGFSKKANMIETSIGKVPVEQRHLIGLGSETLSAPNAGKVLEALALHRVFGLIRNKKIHFDDKHHILNPKNEHLHKGLDSSFHQFKQKIQDMTQSSTSSSSSKTIH